MNKVYSIIILPLLWIIPNITCQTEFDCKPVVEKGGNYSLEITLKNGSSEGYAFELHDLNTGTLVLKKDAFFTLGEKKVIFESVRPSTYVIYFSSNSCVKKKAIPGKGIILE